MSHIGYPEASKAWKTALKWVLENIEVDDFGRCMVCVSDIKEELEK